MQKKKGFTLIELLVVISIISFLSSIVLASLNTARAKARDVQRISDMKQLQNALELYRNDHGSYPVQNNWTSCYSSPGINTALRGLIDGGYIKQIPVDPFGGSSTKDNNCWNYEYKDGTPQGYWCEGENTGYAYSLRFTTENPLPSSWLKFYNGQGWQTRGGYEYCMVMKN